MARALAEPATSQVMPAAQASPLAHALARFQAGESRFALERAYRRIQRPLEALAAALRAGGSSAGALLAPDFAGAFAPDKEETLRLDAQFDVRRGAWETAPAGAGAEARLMQWLRPHLPLRVVEVECTASEAPDAATVRARVAFDLAGADRWQAAGAWLMEWHQDRLRRCEPLAIETVRMLQPGFTDLTTAAFAADLPFLLRDTNYWRSVLDAAAGVDIFGNYGISTADIDGDGQDEIYLCQPQGLPNRLYRQVRPGEFREIAASAGLDLLDATPMALFADLRNLGRQDAILITQSQPLLFLNDGRGRFEFAPGGFPATASAASLTGAALADYDGDGFLDLFVCSYGYFQGTGASPLPAPYYDAHNGPPNHLYRNRGDGTFEDVTRGSGLDRGNDRFSFACVWADVDDDGRPDLCVINDFGQNDLYLNRGDGKFQYIPGGVPGHGAGMSGTVGDWTGAGQLGLYVGNMWSAAGQRITADPEFQRRFPPAGRAALQEFAAGNATYRSAGGGLTRAPGPAKGRWSWCCDSFDCDNDGRADLYCLNGFLSGPEANAAAKKKDVHTWLWGDIIARSPAAPNVPASGAYRAAWAAGFELAHADHDWNGHERNVFWLNLGAAGWADVSAAAGLDFRDDGRAFAIFDFDNDGDADLVIHSRTGPQLRLLRNDLAGGNRSLAITLRATRGNRDAIGARLDLRTASGRQLRQLACGSGFLAQHSKRLVFGLGSERVAALRVHWPGGATSEFPRLESGYHYVITEGSPEPVRSPLATSNGELRSAPPPQAETPPERFATVLTEPLPLPSPSVLGWRGPAPSGIRRDKTRSLVWLARGAEDGAALAPWQAAQAAGAPALLIRFPPRGTAALSPNEIEATPRFQGFAATLMAQLFDRRRPVALPTGWLLNRGELVKVYWGGASAGDVLADLRGADQGGVPLRGALPFPGRSVLAAFHRDTRGLGAALATAGLNAEADLYLALAAKMFPDDPDVFYNLALVRRGLGNRSAASAAAQRALALRPHFAEAENLLGVLAMEGGAPDAARFLRTATEDAPDFSDAWNNLGYLQLTQGDLAGAQRSLDRALALSPNFANALNNRGILAARNGDRAAAEADFRQALALAPNDLQAGNNLAVLYAQQGQAQKAVATFQELLKQDPEARDTLLNFARLELILHDRAAARALLGDWLGRHPNDRAAAALLARTR
ncbi:MAG: FG-GAP-like repeat-containing protein [Terriglobales bacterium]